MQGIDAQLLTADSDILSCQHCCVWGGLITVCLDLHAAGDTSDGFTTTTISKSASGKAQLHVANKPEIGNVHEGIVERSKDARNSEDELTASFGEVRKRAFRHLRGENYPSRTWGPREMFSWAGRALGGAMAAADAVLLLELLAWVMVEGVFYFVGVFEDISFSQIPCVLT